MNMNGIIRFAVLVAFAAGIGGVRADYYLRWEVTGSQIEFDHAAVQVSKSGYSALLLDPAALEKGYEVPYVVALDGGQTTREAMGLWQSVPPGDLSDYSFQVRIFDVDNNLIGLSEEIASFSKLTGEAKLFPDGMSTESANVWQVNSFTAVPEPTSGMLFLLGLASLALRRKKVEG